MQIVTIKAPLSGVIFPLEEVPDPVFAEKMVGDGISIDPSSSILYAPIDGTVTHIHPALHALTVTHSSGLEVMMHIGLDTVMLKSQGFQLKTNEGLEVKMGDALIEFDMNFVDKNAKALLTQIILTNDEMVENIEKSEGYAECNETTLMHIHLKEIATSTVLGDSREEKLSQTVIIHNQNGLHARPAAALASLAKKFTNEISLIKDGVEANAKSITSIMKLDIRCGDEIEMEARGANVHETIHALISLIESGLGEDTIQSNTNETPQAEEYFTIESNDPNILLGVSASDGIAIGRAVRMDKEHFVFDEDAKDSPLELGRLIHAIDSAKEELTQLISSLDDGKSDIFTAHQELLSDPEILSKAEAIISDKKSAEFAWSESCKIQAQELEHSKSSFLVQRANDIRDISDRVLRLLTNSMSQKLELPENAILIASEMTPSLLVDIDRENLLGFCVARGGASSHVAILARSMDIPAVVGVGERLLDIQDGEALIVDATQAQVLRYPSQELLTVMQEKQQEIQNIKAIELEDADADAYATTTDNKRIEIVANIGGLEDALSSLKYGTEGVGLLRSEFLFLGREVAPSEDEQFEIYRDIAVALDGRSLTIRTLDVGGDKPLAYLSLPAEENPFLGIRGVRIGLQYPDMLRTQIRAILRANEYGTIRIMFPMIATIYEIKKVKDIVEEERLKLSAKVIEIGIMVEVPSTALLAKHFAKEVDFFSIGTNDLTQYTLAMDRGHPQLASQLDTMDPSVLQLIKMTVEGAKSEGKRVAICGGIASDPLATALLVGLGIDKLSVTPPTIPTIKASIRKYSTEQCIDIALKALACSSAQEVRKNLRIVNE